MESLTVRNGHAMAYDRDNAVVVPFGGADERQVLADLWAWNGQQWRCLAEGGPPPRIFPALAYDGAEKQLILFGGNRVLFGTDEDTDPFLDGMWAWDGRAWRQIHTSTPAARAEAAVAYDSDRQRIVLFGGYRVDGGERTRFGDTWEWDGRRWEQVSSEAPSARNGAAVTYDAQRKRVVLFGGSGTPDETWEWDGRMWEQVVSAETEGRFNSAMAYDPGVDALIRFGGWTREGRVGGTWQYDGARWTRLTDEGPAPRNHTAMVYDSRRGTIALFGGHDGDRVFGDTWEWNGRTWLLKTERSPRLRVDNGH